MLGRVAEGLGRGIVGEPDTVTHGPKQIRLLMANEPRAYREVIAEAVRDLRPSIKVMTVEPGELDDSVSNFRPDMVICSAATEMVKKNVLIWIELYPEFSPKSVISVKGESSKIDEIQLADLLEILDRAERLLENS